MTRDGLFQRGIARIGNFCEANALPVPLITPVNASVWWFDVCAYWRPNEIVICLEKCATAAPDVECRNWNWPGSTTDREPFGVLAHELGHCADWHNSERRGEYFGNTSVEIRKASGEKPLTSYCPNDAEWFAEHFRLFVTNHALLRLLFPKTHALFSERWKPVSDEDWMKELGPTVPARIIRTLTNKIAKVPSP